MSSDMRSLSLPSSLCEAVEQKFGGQFDGLEALLAFVLGELLRDESIPMDQAEQRMVAERLKDLGYV